MILIILAIILMLAVLFYAEYRDQQRERRLAATPRRHPMLSAYEGFEVVDLTDPIGSTLPNKENPMDAHEQYKLIEAAGRLLLAGAEVVELPDGRNAIALPGSVAVAVLSHVNEYSPLEREVMERMGS